MIYIEKPDENFSNDTFTDVRSAEICRYFSQEVLKQFPMDCWVAGGSIVSKYLEQDFGDIDIFFPGENEIFEAKDFLETLGGKVVHESDFSLKMEIAFPENDGNDQQKYILDLVKVMHKGPKQTIEAFDMFCCQVAINKDGWLYYGDGFFKDMNERIMRLNKKCKVISDEARIIQRLAKYGKKGFELPLSEADKWVKFLAKSREEAEKNKLDAERKKKLAKKVAEGYIPYN